MPVAKSQTMKPWFFLVGGGLVVGAAVWGVTRSGREDADGVPVPATYSVDALKARRLDAGASFRDLRQVMGDDELTDDQKRQVGKNLRQVRQASVRERMDEYYNADATEQTAILDRHIDAMQEWLKGVEQRREEREKSGDDEMSDEERRLLRTMLRPQSKQERKDRSESRSPDDTARVMVYFTAIRTRAQERGIQMSRGPGGGGRGGPGGGGGRRGP